MNCEDFYTYIDDFIDNILPDEINEQILSHINSCPQCKKEFDDRKKTVNILRSMPKIAPPEDFLARINNRIDNECIKPQKRDFKKIFNYRTYSAAAACILCVVVIKVMPELLSYQNVPSTDNSSEIRLLTPRPTAVTVELTKDSTAAPQIPSDAVVQDNDIYEKENTFEFEKINEMQFSPNNDLPAVSSEPQKEKSVRQQSDTAAAQSSDTSGSQLAQSTPTDSTADEIISPKRSVRSKPSIQSETAACGGAVSLSLENDTDDYSFNAEYKLKTSSEYKQQIDNIISNLNGSIYNGYYTINSDMLDEFTSKLNNSDIPYSISNSTGTNSEFINIYVIYENGN